jgi:hypothetical protein
LSALSLGNLAAERDERRSGDEVRSASETLVAIIPTEVLVPYTTMVSIAMSIVSSGQYAPFRWGAYAAFVLLAAIAPIASFRSQVRDKRLADSRKIPFPECACAAFAAAGWGLVMPGSPLSLVLRGDSMTLASGAIVLGTGTLLAFISTFLKRANDRSPLAAAVAKGGEAEPAQDESTRDVVPNNAGAVDMLGYRSLSTR